MPDASTLASAVLRIDLQALAANYRAVRAQVAPALLAGVVKANGYGLGAAQVASALAETGCSHFFVAQIGEALSLKPILRADASLYVLNGLPPGTEAACAGAGAIPVLNSLDQVDRWSNFARVSGRILPAALQFDSGMSRLGLPPTECLTLLAEPQRLNGVELRLVMSHLACADDPGAPANLAQLRAFAAVAERFPDIPRSLDNSGGSFLPRNHLDLVRAGIALYGGSSQIGRANPFQQVVTLETHIVQLRDVPIGEGVGYGLTFVAERPTRLATIPVGYGDGWPRHLGDRGAAYIAGFRAPIAGRVSMDSITLDVTDVPDALLRPGAPVELLGPNQTIDDVATDAGTIAYEILTRLGARYHRLYVPAHTVTL